MTTSKRVGYTREDARRDLAEVYARIPAVECKGRCADSCTVIDCTALERDVIADSGVTLGPPIRHTLHLKLIARGRHQQCPALGPLRTCTVYEDRPAICRAFGAARGLRCEHGCRPDRELTDAQMYDLFAEVFDIDERWRRAGRP